MLSSTVRAEIENAVKATITTVAPLSAANNAHIYRVNLSGNRTIVAKVAERGMDTEAFMLGYLKKNSKLPVPDVYYSNEHIIIMQFVQANFSIDFASQAHAAELLAELHKITAPSYGFERDTLIGALRQPNPQSSDWIDFFTQHRLLYMGGEALNEGKIDAKMMRQLEKLAGKLPGYLKNPNPPALIHGDVWGGNILAGTGKVLAFIDPAIYHADPEMELAFIAQDGSLGEVFFRRYNDITPIRFGFFEERKDIYAIYPLLVNTRIFGASYARKIQKILDKLA